MHNALLSLIVHLIDAWPPPTAGGMLADLAYPCVLNASWNTLLGAFVVRLKRQGPRAVVLREMDPLDGSARELPCSLGLRPPARHHQRAGEE